MVRAAARSSGAAGSRAAGPVVQPWDIRQAGQIGGDQLRAIGQLHEFFARNLTHSIGAYLRSAFDCSLVSAEHLTYREFLQRIPGKNLYRVLRNRPGGSHRATATRSRHRLSHY